MRSLDRPVRVAVVDSGINPRHPHVAPVSGGVRFFADDDGYVAEDGDFTDCCGHGTAVAGLIRAAAPDAEIYAVRILDAELRTFPTLLCVALEWATRNGMDLVNVSIGTLNTAVRRQLAAACESSIASGAILVAAACNGSEDPGWPCAIPGVIGVQAGSVAPGELIKHDGPVTLTACGHPRDLPGLAPGRNYQGNSFAAGRVSGRIAALLASHPDVDPQAMLRLLGTR